MAYGLQIHDVRNPRTREYVVATSDALVEAEAQLNRTQVVECEITLAKSGLQPGPELVDAGQRVDLPIHDTGVPNGQRT